MSAQSSPMTRSAAARLRAKRKSGGAADEAGTNDVPMADADGVQGKSESPATKRRKLPVRAKEAEEPEEQEQQGQQLQEGQEGQQAQDEDSSDSDDEAPEAISTAQAAAASRHSAQKASQASEKRAANEKRKRQERDARLKSQAEVRKAREEKAAQEANARAEAAAAEAAAAAAATAPPKATSKLLPLELLDSDSEDEDEDDDEDNKLARRAPTSSKLAKRARKKDHPRDRQLGTTVYRVLTDGGPKTLPPKLAKQARNKKQLLLARNRTGTAVNRGFLRR